MKSNPQLQASLKFQSAEQKVWYAAHVLLAACSNSPAIAISPAQPKVDGKRAIPAYAGFTGFPAKTAAQNTTGYAAGEVFPGRAEVPAQAAAAGYLAVARIPAVALSPAYPSGTAIPNYPVLPPRAEQVLVLPKAAVVEVKSPAIKAVPGWIDAVDINTNVNGQARVIVELPLYGGAGLIGSDKMPIGEITDPLLQATVWVDTLAGTTVNNTLVDVPGETLEQFLFRNALLCVEHTIADIVRNVAGTLVNCKRITVLMDVAPTFNASSDLVQLDKILPVSLGGGN
jgi:hypothetical protein